MEVWFLLENRLQKAQMEVVGLKTIREKMKELGITKAEVVAWPRTEKDPIEFGKVEIRNRR